MNEKSTSIAQQRLMGMAYAYKKGELDTEGMDEELLDKIKDIADGMSEKDLKDFASTKHDDLPMKAERLMSFEQFKESKNV